MKDHERWRSVVDFPEYLVSTYGNIKHVDRVEPRTPGLNHQGFPTLVLFHKGEPTRYVRQVNRLVAEAWLDPAEYSNETSIWHIDGDIQNCRADNLRWELRPRVLEWNEMHRTPTPKYKTPRVLSAKTGVVYENAFAAGMAEGELESSIVFHIDKYPDQYADRARYRYVE